MSVPEHSTEQHLRILSQLADRLDVPLDTVVYAVRALHRAGLIELVRVEPAGVGANTVRRVYRALRRDWDRVVDVLIEFVPPAPSPDAPGTG